MYAYSIDIIGGVESSGGRIYLHLPLVERKDNIIIILIMEELNNIRFIRCIESINLPIY